MSPEKSEISDPELQKIVDSFHASIRKRKVNFSIRLNEIMVNARKEFDDLHGFLSTMQELRNTKPKDKVRGDIERKLLDFFVKYQDKDNFSMYIDEFISNIREWKTIFFYYHNQDSNLMNIYTIDIDKKRINKKIEDKPLAYSWRGHRDYHHRTRN